MIDKRALIYHFMTLNLIKIVNFNPCNIEYVISLVFWCQKR